MITFFSRLSCGFNLQNVVQGRHLVSQILRFLSQGLDTADLIINMLAVKSEKFGRIYCSVYFCHSYQ